MKKKDVKWEERKEALKLSLQWTYRASPLLTGIIFFVIVFGGLLVILEPYLFQIIIDSLTQSSDLGTAEALAYSLIGVLVVYGVAKTIQSVLWDVQALIKHMHGKRIDKIVTEDMMKKVSSLDAVYFEDPQYYNTLMKSNENNWRVNNFFWEFTFFAGQLLSTIVILIALLTFNWIIVVLILFAAIPSIFLAFKKTSISWGIYESTSPLARRAQYYRQLMTTTPEAVKEIRLFGLQKHFLKRYSSLLEKYIKEEDKAILSQIWLVVFGSLVNGVFSVLAAWFVIEAYFTGAISIGQVTFYWALLFQFSQQARYMVTSIGALNEGATFIAPLVRLFAFKNTITNVTSPKPFPKKFTQGIEFRNVSFRYPREKRYALRNFSLHIHPGENIALVGENGSGKTTMVKLLTRLYDVTEGEILIEGVNIKEYKLDDLYKNIGVIFQDFIKYEALIAENIAYGEISKLKKKDNVHRSAVQSRAWDFIKTLEKQYKTHIGKTLEEKGTELSLGQWQKIALARAFFKDAKILCLDEPTAAVDARAEYMLFQKFKKLTKGKMTFLISHRFSTVRMADKIVVLQRGKMVEQGDHKTLLKNKKLYSQLFAMQAEGYRE